MKHFVFLFLVFLNHVITSNEFFHCIREDLDLISFTAFSKMVLLILLSLFFPGLKVLHLILKGKFFLWSLIVINASGAENFVILLSCLLLVSYKVLGLSGINSLIYWQKVLLCFLFIAYLDLVLVFSDSLIYMRRIWCF